MKKLLLVGLTTTLVSISAGVSGWAVVNYYKENVKTLTEQLNEAIDLKIIPSIDKKLTLFSSEWMSSFATDNDFDFKDVEGYNKNLKYNIVAKEAIGQKLMITIKVLANDFETGNYNVMLPDEFSTPDVSSQSVINQTIEVFPKYIDNLIVSELPKPDTTIDPSTIVIKSPDFHKDALGKFIFKKNGGSLLALKTLDLYSSETDITEFIIDFINLSGSTLPEEEIRKNIEKNISLQNTIILFEVNDNSSSSYKNATIIVKDFSDVDYSNFIENAKELRIRLSSDIYIPTAREIMASIDNNNPLQYLEFVDQLSTSNFLYNIKEATLMEDDAKEETLRFTITITQTLNLNSKTYLTTLGGLLSVQQKELNDIVNNDAYNNWAIKPFISAAYINRTIEEIIDSPDYEAFEFSASQLQRYPNYKYVVNYPGKIVLNGKEAISIYVEMVHKLYDDVSTGYWVNITTGFKP
ncbi:MAG: hypothetical protein ACRCWU_02160 [Metamycoplasmataceae bacterium]